MNSKHSKIISMGAAVFMAMALAMPAIAEEPHINFDQGNMDIPKILSAVKDEPIQDFLPEVSKRTTEESKATILVGTLSPCSKNTRSKFLAGLIFLDGKIASLDVSSVQGCVADEEIRQLLSRIGGGQKKPRKDEWCVRRATCEGEFNSWCTEQCNQDGDQSSVPERLFAACSESVRGDFFDSLVFVKGRLAGMYLGGIESCSTKADMTNFLSLFDQKDDDETWKEKHECRERGTCSYNPKYTCNLKTC